MTADDFKPQVWSAKIKKNLDAVNVAKKMTNRDYESDLVSYGTSVKIVQIGDLTVGTYSPNTDLSSPETVDMAGLYFPIDQGDTIHFYVDDLDKLQARADFTSRMMQRATYALARKEDYYLFTVMAAGVASANVMTANTYGLGAGEKSILEGLAQMQVALDEANVTEDGRIAYLPPWMEAMLRLDERYTGFNTAQASGPLAGTPIGRAMGFTIYKTNNLPRATGSPLLNTGAGAYTIIAGHPDSTTFADSIDKMEAYKPPLRFGDAVKGLHVYGSKVITPEAITTLAATRGSFV